MWAQKDEPHPTHLGPYPIASWKPDAVQLGLFAHALALRYGGTVAALPRVRYFEVWDEPNLSQYLSPQVEGGKLVAAEVYRDLVNSFARAVHGVHGGNVVVAGSLSAFSFLTPYGRLGIAPLQFMRRMLCMSAGSAPRATCNTTVDIDAFSIHPWTSGGPTHHASEKDDVSLGDLPKLRRLLAAAAKAGHIRPNRMPELWITEFAWDTRPPDTHPETAPMALQSRWVAEAVYQAWKNDVRVFTWLLLWDQLYPWDSLQSGLFFRNGEDFRFAQPKPTFYAFRFPFVAYRNGGRISLWGKTPHETLRPGGGAATIVVALALDGNVPARQERDLPGVGALPEAARRFTPLQPVPPPQPRRIAMPSCRRTRCRTGRSAIAGRRRRATRCTTTTARTRAESGSASRGLCRGRRRCSSTARRRASSSASSRRSTRSSSG